MRSVLFVDPPAFCTSLEGMVAPALRTRPLAVAPPGADRATILALSAEARLAGLKRGMPVRTAQRLCPDLIVLPPNPRLYARASRALHEILRIYAPTIEPRGYGHAFLDLTGTGRLFGPPQDVAARIRREVSSRLRLAVSVGIATNKLVSQAAIKAGRRGSGEAMTQALLYVPSGDERGFLAPQPLEVMPELDSRVRMQLDDYQLDLIGEVAAIPESALCAVFGRGGRTLRARARGIDPRPVLPPERQSEFHVTHTLTTDTNDLGILFPLLRLMSERLGRQLRRRGLAAGRLRVETVYSDYTVGSRALPLPAAVLDADLCDTARRAFVLSNTKRLTVRTVALTLDRLIEAEAQLELWGGKTVSGYAGRLQHTDEESSPRLGLPASPPSRIPTLQHALDHIRTRYGAGALRGSPLPSHFSPLTSHHSTTILPKVALPSMTRCASAS
jgi:DNA polymerase-4